MIFRKNYLPDLNVYQDTEGKWFAESQRDGWCDRHAFTFIREEEDGFVSRFSEPTKFETLDDLMAALYEYTYKEHLEAIKKQITYNKVKVSL